jgi:hypothetical protein
VRLPGWAAPLLLGVLCLLVYNANLRTIGAGDTLPARYQPLILWHDGTFALDGNARLVAHGHPLSEPNPPAGTSGTVAYFQPWAYWLIHTRRGQLASLYPVVAPLLVAPLYLPAVLWLNSHGWEQPQIDRVAEIMEKVSASLLAAIASLLMFLVLRREGNPWALPLALAFAFGTDTWMISSQALWQHGSGVLLVTLALLLALARASPLRTGLLGLVCVLIAANRPPDALIAGAFMLFAVWSRRREAVWLLAGAALPLAALLYYNLGFIGNLVGGYALAKGMGKHFFHVAWLGLPGLLVSPARGLLVFSPFLIFLPVGLTRRLRTPSSRKLAVALSVAVVAQLFVYSQTDWRAGVSWGPRWLTDLLPVLVWMLAPAPLALRRLPRGLLVATMVAAVGVQAIGAFWYTKKSDERIFAGNPASTSGAWDPSNTPFVVELEHQRAPFELQCGTRFGSIDQPPPVLNGTGAVPKLQPGTAVQGWALVCGRTPAQVILLIDGRVIGETPHFSVRPDVNRALHITAASGWSVTADTSGIVPGEHVLQLAVRVSPRSDIRILREEPVMVTAPPDLNALAVLAARRLREDQARAGYWLTKYTSSPQYVAPQEEMNTYLTSTLVDLLAPVEPKLGLAHVVARARRELAAQVESNGLVRYHGLPNAPTIRKLGCVITPDADDTALVWRIAGPGPGDPRLRRMLRTLARYRDGRGLYRTWLAPQSRYKCLDPGRDPDPADIGIQMHVYLMLREFDRPAARVLCKAIQRWSGNDDVWVYYANTALVPYLRSAELEQLGCPIPLPTARLARPVPGQEWWSEAARLLVQTGPSGRGANARQAIRDLLTSLGDNDFALLRLAPPLLYHNDLTASVKRFYWSEDAGYALWLRLYEAAKQVAR